MILYVFFLQNPYLLKDIILFIHIFVISQEKYLIEEIDVVVNLIADDVWGSEDDLTVAFSDKVNS